MYSKDNNNSIVVTVKRDCNALRAVRTAMSQKGMSGRCELYLKLQEKANSAKQRIVLFELPEKPYHYLAYVGTTKVCVVEVEPTVESGAEEIIGEKETVEALLAYLAGGNGGLNGLRGQCEECSFKGRFDCYKEGIRNIMIEKDLLEEKVDEVLTVV